MRLLHTSDWHLGKRLAGKDLLSYQREIVLEIASIAESKNVDVVVLAGDVFDGPNPTPESVGVFLEAVERITAGGERAMVVVAGKSDNPAMLKSLQVLSKRINLAIYTDAGAIADTDTNAAYRVKPVETGRGYIVYCNDKEERIVVAGLPVSSLSVRGEQTLEAAAEKGLDTVTRRFSDETYNILVTDLPMKLETPLSEEEGGERKDALSCGIFPSLASYVALGGMHKSEVASQAKSAYYSGSILPYGFDDNKGEKGVVVAYIGPDKEVRKEITKFKSGKRLKRIRCTSLQDAMSQLDRYFDCLVELNLSLTEPLSAADSKMLSEKYANLLQINLAVTSYKGDAKKPVARLSLSPKELFEAFYSAKNGGKAPEELTELYLQLTEDKTE